MIKVYAFAADGTEECELLNVVNVLKRSNISTTIVSIKDTKEVISAHNLHFLADEIIDDVNLDDATVLYIPGGLPGSTNLSNCKKLIDALEKHIAENKLVAAICAAPAVVLGQHGFLKGRTATCYPGFEDGLIGATHSKEKIVKDGNIITGRGLGCSFELGFEIIKTLLGEEVKDKISNAIQY